MLGWLRQVFHSWLSPSGREKTLTVGGFGLLSLLGVLSFLLGTGVVAALQAGDLFDEVEAIAVHPRRRLANSLRRPVL